MARSAISKLTALGKERDVLPVGLTTTLPKSAHKTNVVVSGAAVGHIATNCPRRVAPNKREFPSIEKFVRVHVANMDPDPEDDSEDDFEYPELENVTQSLEMFSD